MTRLEAVLAKMVELEASQDPYMLQVNIDIESHHSQFQKKYSVIGSAIYYHQHNSNPGVDLPEGWKIWEDLKVDVGGPELQGGAFLLFTHKF